MNEKEFAAYIFDFLYSPALDAWRDVPNNIDPDKRQRVEDLAGVGYPTILIPIDTEWKLDQLARIVIVVEPESYDSGKQDQIFDIGGVLLTDDYRNALRDLCRVSFGDLDAREGEIHRAHQSGEVALACAVDIKRKHVRLFASPAAAPRAVIGLVEIGEPRDTKAVLH